MLPGSRFARQVISVLGYAPGPSPSPIHLPLHFSSRNSQSKFASTVEARRSPLLEFASDVVGGVCLRSLLWRSAERALCRHHPLGRCRRVASLHGARTWLSELGNSSRRLGPHSWWHSARAAPAAPSREAVTILDVHASAEHQHFPTNSSISPACIHSVALLRHRRCRTTHILPKRDLL